MDTRFREAASYLKSLGVSEVPHTEHTYMAHLAAVYKGLESWGCGEDACLGGMFHSIYGTEIFTGFMLPYERRGEVRDVIGERAERLAWLNCVMDRTSFDEAARRTGGPYFFRNRLTGKTVGVEGGAFEDLCRIHLFDWLEQVSRSKKWTYRREAYRHLAVRLGRAQEEAFEYVYSAAPAP